MKFNREKLMEIAKPYDKEAREKAKERREKLRANYELGYKQGYKDAVEKAIEHIKNHWNEILVYDCNQFGGYTYNMKQILDNFRKAMDE